MTEPRAAELPDTHYVVCDFGRHKGILDNLTTFAVFWAREFCETGALPPILSAPAEPDPAHLRLVWNAEAGQ